MNLRDYTVTIKDKVTMLDHLGNRLFTVDRWIYETALKRGDLERWFTR